MTYFLFVCLFPIAFSSAIAQFSSDKIDLIETTARREFNSNIIKKYLLSSDSSDVVAALISSSHSDDTSFVTDIVSLDFNKYGKWISFALGQIGNSYSAKDFLFRKLSENNSDYSEFILSAIGKIGNQIDLSQLIEIYNQNPELKSIEEAILQFRIRNITNELSKKILVQEYSKSETSVYRKKNILFTLARLGSDSTINYELIEILNNNTDNEVLQLALMNFRVQKFFPANEYLIDKLFHHPHDEIRTELVKCLPYSKTQNKTLNIFSSVLSDNEINENILFETLKALQMQKWENVLLKELNIDKQLKHLIQNHSKNFIVIESIRTYTNLYGIEELSKDTSLMNSLSELNIIQILIAESKDLNFSVLLNLYEKISVPKQKLNALEAFLGLMNKFSTDTNFINFIFKQLQSDDAAIISIIADGIDSSFIINHTEQLKKIISDQAIRFRNNPDFIEAEFSLINLSKKISDEYQNELISYLSDTKLYSLRKYLRTFDNKIEAISKQIPNLSEFFQDAFNYSRAVIKTNKGNIVIKFKPEFAPVTVGNFIYLAKKNFYNGIVFHRVVPGFVIQAGDPTGTGWGGPGHEIISEFSPLEFRTGAVGIASAGKDTEGSQFFIMQGYYPHLNSRYTLFAEVISGLDVVMKISEDDRIISIEIEK